jgi:hypothetical protein
MVVVNCQRIDAESRKEISFNGPEVKCPVDVLRNGICNQNAQSVFNEARLSQQGSDE